VARQAYRLLGGRHLGRVDLRVPETGSPVVLEMNPIPGFTATSLLPKAAAASGIDFPSLCVQLINLAEKTHLYGPSKT
jgi:D-alanine-D-alanine ligase-like ATP-grasp enzyme